MPTYIVLSVDKTGVSGFPERVHSRRNALILGSALFGGGALLTLVATVLPRSPQVDVAGAWVLFLAAATAAAIFWLGRDSFPFWMVFVGILLGTAMITMGVYVNGERDGGAAAVNEIYYVWPVSSPPTTSRESCSRSRSRSSPSSTPSRSS